MPLAIQTASATLPPLLEDPVQELLAHLSSGAPRSLISLLGLPGAGKSTLAARLGDTVNEQAGKGTMVVLGMDGFHLTKTQLKQRPDSDQAFLRRGAPWTFNAHMMAQRLERIKQSAGCESVWWPDFQHDVGDPRENVHEIGPAVRLVLVEGLYLLHGADGWDEVRQQFDQHWCLDTPLEVALERLALRHMSVWQLTREEAQRRIATNDQFNADIVMDSWSRADRRIMDR